MFTGIIEEVGDVIEIQRTGEWGTIGIKASRVLEETKIGDSIAVNGVCLTVTKINRGGFFADIMAETMRRTNLGMLERGSQVNLERAMSANGRFGGHIVSGHIDGTGIIRAVKREGNAVWVFIETKPEILQRIVEKGSIAVDGISLTVAAVNKEVFQVSIIPHTGEATTLLRRCIGEQVNLENDMVGKYIQKMIQPYAEEKKNERKSKITIEYLQERGF